MTSAPDEASAGSYQGARVVPVGVMVASEWASEAWHHRVQGVVSGQRFAGDRPSKQLMRDGETLRLYLWTGFRLHLYRRYVNDYALNIRNDAPSVFVVHRRPGPDGLEPFAVTVSMDEAQKLDAPELRDPDEHISKVPMPPEVYRWVEEFVLDHYEPPKRKGKAQPKE